MNFRRILRRFYVAAEKDMYEEHKFIVLKFIGSCKIADIGRISRSLELPGDDVITMCHDLASEGLIKRSAHPSVNKILPTFEITTAGQKAIKKGPLLQ